MRRMISILMLVCFLSLATTGLTMMLGDKGGEKARASVEQSQIDGAVLRPTETKRPQKKFFPKEMHEMTAVIFLVVGCTHLVLNRRAVYRYLGIEGFLRRRTVM